MWWLLKCWRDIQQSVSHQTEIDQNEILPLEAAFTVNTEFGQKYEIDGLLTGPNGVTLRVTTVWIVTFEETRFVTLVPGRAK